MQITEAAAVKKSGITTKELVIDAMLIALTYIFTAFVNLRLPIAANGGLIHLGNVPLFLAAIIFGRRTGTLAEMMVGADVFIGVSAPKVVTPEMVGTMAKDAVVFACANPTPEIFPEEAKAGGARVVATGRSDYPNQINNVLAFPGVFRGARDVRASDINEEMKMAAARALAGLIGEEELSEENIIPKPFDPRVVPAVAQAVAQAARETGVARL